MAYTEVEDILTRLEAEVRRVLSAKVELTARLEDVEKQCLALRAENESMRRSLETERLAREEALGRVNALIQVVAARLGTENVS